MNKKTILSLLVVFSYLSNSFGASRSSYSRPTQELANPRKTQEKADLLINFATKAAGFTLTTGHTEELANQPEEENSGIDIPSNDEPEKDDSQKKLRDTNPLFTLANGTVNPSAHSFPCVTCNKVFSSKHLITTHIRIHTGEKPFKCDVCGKLFSDRSNSKRHITKHTGETPYNCTQCPPKTHIDEKSYECKVCGKLFTQANNLRTHNRIHTGERPFECRPCNVDFADQSHFSHHRNTKKHKRNLLKLQQHQESAQALLVAASHEDTPLDQESDIEEEAVQQQPTPDDGPPPLKCLFCNIIIIRGALGAHMAQHTHPTHSS